MIRTILSVLAVSSTALLAACGARGNPPAEGGAPPPAAVDREGDGGSLHVERPERFPVVPATSRMATPTLTVTGVVDPDVSRAVPVVSLASGRVVELHVRLGDDVKRGQLLLRIHSADVSGAIADYRKARADEVLATSELQRAQDLYERGAIAKKDLEIAQDTAAKAAVDVENGSEHLRVLGVDPDHAQSGIIDIVAPASGIITEQNVTNAGGVKTLDNSPNLLTISDLSTVWIVCDVPETDLPTVHVGDAAEIRLTAFPDRVLTGRISNIGPILDPTLRTAKVRVEVSNPGIMRIGMFVTATFHGQKAEEHTVVPASAVLHLHDRDWVYVAGQNGEFHRQEIVGGQMLPGNMQEVVSGLRPDERVVSNALVFQNTVEQ